MSKLYKPVFKRIAHPDGRHQVQIFEDKEPKPVYESSYGAPDEIIRFKYDNIDIIAFPEAVNKGEEEIFISVSSLKSYK
jgi:hypothetical protein